MIQTTFSRLFLHLREVFFIILFYLGHICQELQLFIQSLY